MAQTQQPAPRSNIIDQFQTLVLVLIQECARYSAEGPGPDGTEEEASGNIARLRSLTAALNGAINAINRPPTFMMPPAMEPPPISPAPQMDMPSEPR